MPTKTNANHRTAKTVSRPARRRAILRLVTEGSIPSQAELARRLERQGFRVNQGTLSRDLRDLGLVKGPQGYALPPTDRGTGAALDALQEALARWLMNVVTAQNQLLLKTPPGGAQALALTVDRSGLPEVLGTVAGDDTVLVVCADARRAASLKRRLERMA